MKDVQGIQRGKCNICECSEYRTPSGDGVSCEYCGHRPGEHVQMVALGQCMTKDCDCDQYQSEDPNSYSKCCYCGCTASTHQGAEAVQKKPHQRYKPVPTSQYSPQLAPATGVGYVQGVGQPHMIAPPMAQRGGTPRQTTSQGTCLYPGCQYPRWIEGTKVHPYCSKTCAQKHSQLQSSFHAQKLAAANQAAKMASPQATPTLPTSTNICKKCRMQSANPGRSWCELCYQQQQRQLRLQQP